MAPKVSFFQESFSLSQQQVFISAMMEHAWRTLDHKVHTCRLRTLLCNFTIITGGCSDTLCTSGWEAFQLDLFLLPQLQVQLTFFYFQNPIDVNKEKREIRNRLCFFFTVSHWHLEHLEHLAQILGWHIKLVLSDVFQLRHPISKFLHPC